MKKLLIMLLLVSGTLLCAQEMPFISLRHSAVCADGFMRLSWDDASAGLNPINCFYSINDAAWVAASPGAQPNSEALLPYQYGQGMRYRLHSLVNYDTETIAFMHAAYLGADNFPPALDHMGLAGTDATGDSIMIYVPALDITTSHMAATSTKIYSTIGNVTGTFPTFNSMTSFNAWMTLLMNPTGTPEVGFAMVYTFNIPGLISPGLYKLGMDAEQNPTFTRLGNIQSNVSSGKLNLSCNIADLTADPDFGIWTGESNLLGMVSAALRIDIDLSTMQPSLNFGDYGVMLAVDFTDHYFSAPYNSLPELTDPLREDNYLRVMYHDANADYPLLTQFQSDSGNVYDMYRVESTGNNAQYQTYAAVEANDSGVFRFSDNLVNMVELAYSWTPVSDEAVPAAPISIQMPNPVRGTANISVKGLQPGSMTVELYNLKGQKLGTLYSGPQRDFVWDGSINGKTAGNGLYYIQISSAGKRSSRRFAIIK